MSESFVHVTLERDHWKSKVSLVDKDGVDLGTIPVSSLRIECGKNGLPTLALVIPVPFFSTSTLIVPCDRIEVEFLHSRQPDNSSTDRP
jgi:hypothetical protein